MADWVHCNKCFSQPGEGRKFSLTNCGHIYCDSCVDSCTKEKCLICSARCTTIHLSAKMKPDVEIFFTEPAEIIKKGLNQAIKVLDFQKNHRQRLMAFVREKRAQQNALQDRVKKVFTQCEDLARENVVLKEENAYLKKLINMGGHAHGGTPVNRPGTPGTSGRTIANTVSPVSNRNRGHSPSGRVSPYSGFRTPTARSISQESMMIMTPASFLQQSIKTPPMPARVSVRTPPSHGKIGEIPRTPSPATQQYRNDSHMSGSQESHRSSPMALSPSSYRGSQQLNTPPYNHSTPKMSYSQTTPSQQMSQSSQVWDPSRRQIQLSFQPKSQLDMLRSSQK